MKYLKHFESVPNFSSAEVKADLDKNLFTIESVLDDHLDEFPGSFTYDVNIDGLSIIKQKISYLMQNNWIPSIDLKIKYFPNSNSPLIKLIIESKRQSDRYNSTILPPVLHKNIKADINNTDPFKRIYGLSDYRVQDYEFRRYEIDRSIHLILKRDF